MKAIQRLMLAGVVDGPDAGLFAAAYLFFRTLESFMRLRGADILRPGSADLQPAGGIYGYPGADMLDTELQKHFRSVTVLSERYLRDV